MYKMFSSIVLCLVAARPAAAQHVGPCPLDELKVGRRIARIREAQSPFVRIPFVTPPSPSALELHTVFLGRLGLVLIAS